MKLHSVTRNLVAREAGVSTATVSRVYNHPERVSKEKRQAVLAAADRLGYSPNKSASALRRSGSGTVALIELPKAPRSYHWGRLPTFNLFYADAVRAVKEVLEESLYHLELETLGSLEEIGSLQRRFDGVIFFDVDDPAEQEQIAMLDIPYAAAHHTAGFEQLIRCATDNVAGGVLQAQLLIEQGAERPLYVTAYVDDVRPHAERLEGFLSLLPDAEVLIMPDLEPGTFDLAAERALTALSAGCDGLAAVNDVVLLRLINHAQLLISRMRAGLPAVGYDAAPFQEILPFSFASVDIQPGAVYRKAARMVIDWMQRGVCSDIEVIPPLPVPASGRRSGPLSN